MLRGSVTGSYVRFAVCVEEPPYLFPLWESAGGKEACIPCMPASICCVPGVSYMDRGKI